MATETSRILVFGNEHASFVHVDQVMQELFTAFIKVRGWERFFVEFE